VELHWKDATMDVLFCVEYDELTEMLDVHMRQFKRAFIAQVNLLKRHWADKCTAYDSQNDEHERLLSELWTAINPDTPLSGRISAQWKTIGFQGKDPATDFRGMGLLGLKNLVYFATHYPEQVRAMIQAERSYPFASSGINMTHLALTKFLKLSEGRLPACVLCDVCVCCVCGPSCVFVQIHRQEHMNALP
jgi:ELMO/CED-12 family